MNTAKKPAWQGRLGEPMKRAAKGMHPEDIKAALRQREGSLEKLSERWGYHYTAISVCLRKQWPAVERRIAKMLDKHPSEIWPDRYNPDGTPKTRRSKANRSSQKPESNMQLREAA
ncbi:helix-turn-helix domain-containing protein [Telmatospirillum sp. J64-1]|uniref:helix-turn-helix domain-containing protein n=1 Tax=Telmatospirillum sp. J64-1 TaxID=2502183 RepID=UPI00115CF0DD|nr:helix-turn-helix domain-containing protein [Telmatospirillum sp. J64-1]